MDRMMLFVALLAAVSGGPYSHMHMQLHKTVLKVDVLTLDDEPRALQLRHEGRDR